MDDMKTRTLFAVTAFAAVSLCANAANPFLPLWEYIPDGEPYVFEDPDAPGKMRVYVYGSHDSQRDKYCGREQVVWSAPVDNLNKWRFDGVIFRSLRGADGRPLEKNGLGDILYAPDVAEVKGPGGKKTYYLYPNTQADGRRNMVAKSDRPDGPFEVCNWDEKDPAKTVGPFGFDPAVLVDDDGRVYGYWGFWRSFAAELDPKTMATVKPGTEIVEDMVSGFKSEGDFRFFEASSIRKIKDKYVFIYSRWTVDGEFGMGGTNYTLAYAYSDKPLGPWTYGGTIIDGRARKNTPDGKTVATATPGGNTHGSICEINGQWYVFYHRQCGLDQFSRQAMVDPITVEVEEGPGGKVVISEAEYTSQGFELEGLDPFETHPAGIACHYTGTDGAWSDFPKFIHTGAYVQPFYADCYDTKDPYDAKVNRSAVVHVTAGSVVGYKYFNFDKTAGREGLELELNIVPHGFDAKVEVWAQGSSAEEGGLKVGEAEISAELPDKRVTLKIDVKGLAKIDGKKALYFVFDSAKKGHSLCDIEDFRFEVRVSRGEVRSPGAT